MTVPRVVLRLSSTQRTPPCSRSYRAVHETLQQTLLGKEKIPTVKPLELTECANNNQFIKNWRPWIAIGQFRRAPPWTHSRGARRRDEHFCGRRVLSRGQSGRRAREGLRAIRCTRGCLVYARDERGIQTLFCILYP